MNKRPNRYNIFSIGDDFYFYEFLGPFLYSLEIEHKLREKIYSEIWKTTQKEFNESRIFKYLFYAFQLIQIVIFSIAIYGFYIPSIYNEIGLFFSILVIVLICVVMLKRVFLKKWSLLSIHNELYRCEISRYFYDNKNNLDNLEIQDLIKRLNIIKENVVKTRFRKLDLVFYFKTFVNAIVQNCGIKKVDSEHLFAPTEEEYLVEDYYKYRLKNAFDDLIKLKSDNLLTYKIVFSISSLSLLCALTFFLLGIDILFSATASVAVFTTSFLIYFGNLRSYNHHKNFVRKVSILLRNSKKDLVNFERFFETEIKTYWKNCYNITPVYINRAPKLLIWEKIVAFIFNTLKSVIFILSFIILFFLLSYRNYLPDTNKASYNCNKFEESLKLPNNIVYPQELQDILGKVFNYYPDLLQLNIRFEFAEISSTMQAQPVVNKNIFNIGKREYVVIINNNDGKTKCFEFESLDEETKIGWIGHELNHITDYNNKSTFELLGFIINYSLSRNFKKEVEKRVDSMTIRRGLGPELLKGVILTWQSEDIDNNYKRSLQELYMSPDQINSLLNDHEKQCGNEL